MYLFLQQKLRFVIIDHNKFFHYDKQIKNNTWFND